MCGVRYSYRVEVSESADEIATLNVLQLLYTALMSAGIMIILIVYSLIFSKLLRVTDMEKKSLVIMVSTKAFPVAATVIELLPASKLSSKSCSFIVI